MNKRNVSLKHDSRVKPPVPFHELEIALNDGSPLKFSSLKGKKVLLVNTASDCGYTNQYEALQELHEKFGNKVAVIGFPANDFKEQEKGNDADIAAFCKANFGVSFPLAKKSSVIPGDGQNAVFKWLTHKQMNGWNEQAPGWNFSKYLVSGDGSLLNYFDASISPMSKEILTAINA